jgi:hypothetical protein
MKTKSALLFGLILAGCVPSWNPLYTQKDTVFDAALLGRWLPITTNEGSKEAWAFGKKGEKCYELQQTDEQGRKANFDLRLVQLGKNRFLDLYLSKVEGDNVNLNAWAGFSLAPAHLILKVEQIEPALKIAAMNPDWLKKLVSDHPDAIGHRIVFDGDVILTASTSDLQKFVLEHCEEGLFGGAMELKRITADRGN